MTTYILGGGCFWCLDAVFRRIRGVHEVVSGYAGGTSKDPTYYDVASGATGHAEVVRITFDDAIILPETLLSIFFTLHDPTTPNRQGADVGTQYRSIMLYSDAAQKTAFETARQRASSLWNDPIVTEIAPLTTFYPAEPEHQDYFSHNPANGYCSVVISPKIAKVRHSYAEYFVTD